MKMMQIQKLLALLLCMVLIAAMALMFTGCAEELPAAEQQIGLLADGDAVGEGEKSFTLKVIGKDGKEITAQISTDAKTVGEALLALEIIAGEDSEYGLYVKTVNGETLDYETDGKYWAFYISDEYSMTGIDLTDIVSGETYVLKAE